LFKGILQGDTHPSFSGFQEPPLHVLAFQQVGCLALGRDLMPNPNRHDNAEFLTVSIQGISDLNLTGHSFDLGLCFRADLSYDGSDFLR